MGDINTEEEICDMACILHTDRFWVSDFNGIIRQINKKGKVLRKVITKNNTALLMPTMRNQRKKDVQKRGIFLKLNLF